MKTNKIIKYKNKTLKKKTIFENITATIDIKLFKYNLNYLRKKAKTDIMPVLKANAYGHGMIEMAKMCRKIGIKHIGVATLGEAIVLRNSGDKGRLLGWLYDVNTNQVKDAVDSNIDIGIFDENHIPIISNMLPKNAKAKIHLFVDTGIDRNGVPYEKALQAAKDISANDKFELVGLMSHFCCAEKKNDISTLKQLELFRKLRKDMLNANINPPLVHIGNTEAIVNYDISDFTIARSGQGIYGYGPDKNLKPIMSLKSKIIQLKYVNKGAGIGYDRKFIARKKTYIGIVPVGYADFLPLTPSSKLSFMVNETKRKVIGLESMDQCVIEAKIGDKLSDDVHIFGKHITGIELAKMAKTTVFEILTHIGPRVHKIYI